MNVETRANRLLKSMDRFRFLDSISRAIGGQTTIDLSENRGLSLIVNDIKGTVPGLHAHHVGQKALMKDLIPNYDPGTAPSILVPKIGHTIRGPNGILSRSMEGLTNPRDVLARDIRELRRVYSDIPNSQLQLLIRMNKDAYPGSFIK